MRILLLILLTLVGCSDEQSAVRQAALDAGLRPVSSPATRPAARVELGRMLFFDPVLSGNRDIACSTCHHPDLATADARPLPIGTGGTGLGAARHGPSALERVARNSPDLFHRADPQMRSMFWDLRLEAGPTGEIVSPAGGLLPAHARALFAAQAMFPVIARQEMRGERHQENNEIGALLDSQTVEIWGAVAARVLAIEAYHPLIRAAFPDRDLDTIAFEDFAVALADFQAVSFHPDDAPWDRFLRGEVNLEPQALEGARVFLEVGCARCHGGVLLTDQKAHNLGVPPLGPGKEPFKPLDVGLQAVTGRPEDAFAFRTPPLRNVTHTAPYMHNGSLPGLREAIAQHVTPEASWAAPPSHLLGEAWGGTQAAQMRVFKTLSPRTRHLSDAELRALEAFLGALTSPSLANLKALRPKHVPSGLPVDGRMD